MLNVVINERLFLTLRREEQLCRKTAGMYDVIIIGAHYPPLTQMKKETGRPLSLSLLRLPNHFHDNYQTKF